MSIKDSSISIGGTPAPLSKYITDHGAAKANNAGKTEVPRDSGKMSDGTTGGNFDLGSMTDRPNNSQDEGEGT
jgi:hypothetical protein